MLSREINFCASCLFFSAKEISRGEKSFDSSRNAAAFESIYVANLRCERTQDPLGIDITTPSLGWQLALSRPSPYQHNRKQIAYQVNSELFGS